MDFVPVRLGGAYPNRSQGQKRARSQFLIGRLLLLLAAAASSLASAPMPATGYSAALPSHEVRPAGTRSDEGGYSISLPLIGRRAWGCAPIEGVQYATLEVLGPPAGVPDENPDLNLAVRGYEATDAYLGLVVYGGDADPGAPQLLTLFADQRVPAFSTAYRVYDWDWDCGCRGDLLSEYPVTLIGMTVTPSEVLHVPDSGYDIGDGHQVVVLYASEERITLQYTREDSVASGYTMHVENVCVEPSLLALYRACDEAGRGSLPALRGNEPFGRALISEIGVAIRDTGTFMDPRSRLDWWQSK